MKLEELVLRDLTFQMMNYARKLEDQKLENDFSGKRFNVKKISTSSSLYKGKFCPESYKTGATKIDSWIDIEGGIGNLFYKCVTKETIS